MKIVFTKDFEDFGGDIYTCQIDGKSEDITAKVFGVFFYTDKFSKEGFLYKWVKQYIELDCCDETKFKETKRTHTDSFMSVQFES